MGFIGREIGNFFVGLMFLTRLPVPGGLVHSEGRLARSARYFPLIGVLVGLVSGAAYVAGCQLVNQPFAAVLAIAVGLLMTGALHEDGLADCCDGLGGGQSREHALEIMRDSRLGTYGVAGLVIALGLRCAALASLPPIEGLLALVVGHAVSRAMITPVMVSGNYARTRGLASSVAGGVTHLEAAFAMLTALGVALIVGPVVALAALAAAIIAGGIVLTILIRKLGGYTGDGLGAIQQVSEIAILAVLAGMWT